MRHYIDSNCMRRIIDARNNITYQVTTIMADKSEDLTAVSSSVYEPSFFETSVMAAAANNKDGSGEKTKKASVKKSTAGAGGFPLQMPKSSSSSASK